MNALLCIYFPVGDAEPVDDTLTLMIGDDGNQRSTFPEAGRHYGPIGQPTLTCQSWLGLVADSYCKRKKRLHWEARQSFLL